MGRVNRNGKFRSKKVNEAQYPLIHIDHDSDFASIKIAPGIEAKSYERDGMLVGEDKKGHVLEVVLLNLSELLHSTGKKKPKSARRSG